MDLGPVAEAALGFFWHSDHTQPFIKPFNSARIRRRDWLTPEVNNRVWVWGSALLVPSVLSCNCFPSSCEAKEPTSRCVSFYLRVWIIQWWEVRLLLYSCQRKDEVKTLMCEEKTRFLAMGSKIRHMNSLNILVQHCVCTCLAGIVSCLSQALNI